MDDQINLIKTKSLECINLILRYIFEQVQDKFKPQSPFLKKAQLFAHGIVTTLTHVSQRPDLEQIILDDNGQNFIVEAVETLVILAAEREFNEDFARF